MDVLKLGEKRPDFMGVRENRAADDYDPGHLSSGIPSGCDAAAGV